MIEVRLGGHERGGVQLARPELVVAGAADSGVAI